MAPTQNPALWSNLAIRAATEHHTRVPLIQGVAIGLVFLAFIICTLRLTIRLGRRTASYEDGFIVVAMVSLDARLVSSPFLTLVLEVVRDSGKRYRMLGYVKVQSDHCIFSDFEKRLPMATVLSCLPLLMNNLRRRSWYRPLLIHPLASLI